MPFGASWKPTLGTTNKKRKSSSVTRFPTTSTGRKRKAQNMVLESTARNAEKRGAKEMIRSTFCFFFSISILFLLTACTGMTKEMTAEDIQKELEKSIEQIPSAEVTGIDLVQSSGGYNATVDLTWTESVGRFSTQKAIEKYSWNFAQSISEHAPAVSAISLSWMVPYHSENEPSIKVSYEKNDSRFEQSDIQDRFTEGSFGADAYINPATSIPASTTNAEAATSSKHTLSENAVRSMHLPRHKTTILPRSFRPRHKSPAPALSNESDQNIPNGQLDTPDVQNSSPSPQESAPSPQQNGTQTDTPQTAP